MIATNTLTTCPSCRQPSLRPAQLEPLLSSHACASCGGQWLRGEAYFRWLDHPDRSSAPGQLDATSAAEVHDSTRAMLCPECGKLLARFRVGHGLSFFIDHCSGCGGIWLDA